MIIAIIAATWFPPVVRAQATLGCWDFASPTGGVCTDQGEAKSAVAAMLKAKLVDRSIICWNPDTSNGVSGYVTYTGPSPSCNGGAAFTAQRSFPVGCAARNANKLADAKPWGSPPATCISGCKVQGEAFSYNSGGIVFYGMRNRTYTGDSCTPQQLDSNAPTNQSESDEQKEDGKREKKPECTALGSGQTSCIKPNGDQCATASTGKTFCWGPTEQGKKTDGLDSQSKSEKGRPVEPPALPPAPDKEWQRSEGHQSIACVNNTCTTYNITNFGSTGSGNAKNGTGDNSVDGSTNTSGNGTPGKGSSQKDGDGDSATDSGNCETAPACVGDTLKCLHLKFTWKIQCNTKGGEVSAGDGCGEGDVPVCAGSSCKAGLYSQVLQQWKQRCATKAMADGMAGRAASISNPDDDGVVDGIWIKDQAPGQGPRLRQDLVNVGGGGSLLPDITLEGVKWEIPQGFYDAIAAIRMVIIAMCTVMAMFIVGRNI